jgi:hypothetical protein
VSLFPTKFWPQSTVQTVAVAVGAAGAAWVTPRSVQKRQFQEMSWTEQPSLMQTIDTILNRLNLPQSNKVQWVAAPSLAKHWLQQVPDQIQSLRELHAVAVQRAQQLFGSSSSLGSPAQGSSWVVSAEWDASQAFLSTAIPSGWHAALMGCVGQPNTSSLNFSASITSPLHLVLSRFKRQLPSHGWLAIAVANTLYLMYFKSKACQHFRSIQLKAALGTEEIQAIALVEWQRDMLRTQQKSDQLHWLCMLPTGSSANANSVLLKPLQWYSTNATSLLDMAGNDASFIPMDSPSALSEVKLAAWCAFQCAENQR